MDEDRGADENLLAWGVRSRLGLVAAIDAVQARLQPVDEDVPAGEDVGGGMVDAGDEQLAHADAVGQRLAFRQQVGSVFAPGDAERREVVHEIRPRVQGQPLPVFHGGGLGGLLKQARQRGFRGGDALDRQIGAVVKQPLAAGALDELGRRGGVSGSGVVRKPPGLVADGLWANAFARAEFRVGDRIAQAIGRRLGLRRARADFARGDAAEDILGGPGVLSRGVSADAKHAERSVPHLSR